MNAYLTPAGDEVPDGLFDDLIPAEPQRAPEAEGRPMGGQSSSAQAEAAQPQDDEVPAGLFDDLIPERPSGVVENFAAGANNALYGMLGGPVDAMTLAINKLVRLGGADHDVIHDPVMGSRFLARAGERVGVHDPEKVEAHGPMERAARAAGAGAAATVAPQFVVGALGKAGMLTPRAMELFQGVFGAPRVGDAAIGAAAGASGDLASQATEEMGGGPVAQTAANLAGGLAGGVAAAGALALPGAAVRAGKRAYDGLLLTDAQREAEAGRRLLDASSNPYALRESLDNMPPELVPGSKPTTFQQTGDLGLGGLERAEANKAPAEFNQRRADQNAARLDALGRIAPEGAPEQLPAALRQARDALDAQGQAAVDAATVRAAEANRAMGGEVMPEVAGAELRSKALAAERSAREGERALWSGVDPDGALALPATSTARTAKDIVEGLPKSARPMDGEEATIFRVAQDYAGDVPLREAQALRSRTSAAMRDELLSKGQTPAYARLARLRGAIEKDIEGAADAPGFDQGAVSRLRAASAATKERAQTFGGLRDILKRSGQDGPFGVPDSAVPGKVIKSGPQGYESVMAYRKAVGDEAAMPALLDGAIGDLRRAAERPDGVLDPAKAAAWRKKNADALRALPGLDERLSTAEGAASAVAELAAARRQGVEDFQRGAVAKLLHLDDPQDVARAVGGVFQRQDAAREMRKLADLTYGKPEARQGLRKAIADHLMERFTSNTEAGTSGLSAIKADQLQTFLRTNRKALRHAFNDQELNLFDRITADLRRANRSISATKAATGGSDTAMNLAGMAKGAPSVLERLVTPKSLGGLGMGVSFLTGSFAPGASALLLGARKELRDAGLTRVDQLVREALLNPEVAKALVARVPAGGGAAAGRTLGQALRKITVMPAIAVTAGEQANRREKR